MKKYEIVSKRNLAERINEYRIYAPLVTKHCKPGQFIILRTHEDGERLPFTICDFDRETGIASVLVQQVGDSTSELAQMNEGECLADFVGPLGNATDLSQYKNICLVGGGVGSAVIFPQCKNLFKEGKPADVIVGARNKDLFFYGDEFKQYAKNFYQVTDDGSNGNKGFVTDQLRKLLEQGNKYDCVFVVGPLPMMKAVCNLTWELGKIPTVASLNSVMIDATGMCGACRLSLGSYSENGEVDRSHPITKFACVDGPEFDGHLVDFDEVIARSKTYRDQETHQHHKCNIRG